MELKQLRYFIQITNDKSFSHAAKNLFLTQQALSKAIANLEEELGLPLFDRSFSGLKLTDYGVLLRTKAITILNQSTEIVNEMTELKNKIDKKVSIVVSYGIINALSPNLLSHFRLLNPGIELIIRDYPDLICEDMVLNNKADIGCVVGPIQDELLESTLVFAEDLYMLINEENELLHKGKITTNDLKSQDYVLSTDDFKIPLLFKLYCKEYGFSPKINYVTNEISLLERLVYFNKGITLLPEHNISRLVYPNICVKKFPDKSLNWEIYLIKRKDRKYPAGVEIFWNYLLNNSNRYLLQP